MKLIYFDAREFLLGNLDGFSDERSNTQRAIVKLLFHSHRRHWDDVNGDTFAIPSMFIEKYVGMCRETFRRVNAKYNFFEVVSGKRPGRARQMKYSDNTLKLIEKFHESNRTKKLMQSTILRGRLVDRPFQAKKLLKVGDLMIKGLIDLDMDALEHYIAHASGRKKVTAMDIKSHASTEQFGYGVFAQDFKLSDNGRVTGMTNSLQNLDRDIREAALNGLYDYDISCCHFAILAQNGKYPKIQEYVDNTRYRRLEVAEAIGVDYEDVKRCFLAMLYGANRGKNERKCAIAGYLGKDKVDSFWDHPYVSDLYGECIIAAKEFLGVDRVDFSELSKCLTTMEGLMLAEITNMNLIHVPMFDGFVSSVALDCKEMERRLLSEFDVKTTVKCRKIDYWGQFEDNGA